MSPQSTILREARGVEELAAGGREGARTLHDAYYIDRTSASSTITSTLYEYVVHSTHRTRQRVSFKVALAAIIELHSTTYEN